MKMTGRPTFADFFPTNIATLATGIGGRKMGNGASPDGIVTSPVNVFTHPADIARRATTIVTFPAGIGGVPASIASLPAGIDCLVLTTETLPTTVFSFRMACKRVFGNSFFETIKTKGFLTSFKKPVRRAQSNSSGSWLGSKA